MENKCLVIFNKKNYLLFLNGNYLKDLIEALKEKIKLNHIVHENIENYEFFIYEEDFKTYVQLDEEILIKNLSKILIKNKDDNDFSFFNSNFSIINELIEDDDSKPKFNCLNKTNVSESLKNIQSNSNIFERKLNIDDKNTSLNYKNVTGYDYYSNQHLLNQADTLRYEFKNKLKIEATDDCNNTSISKTKFINYNNIEWTENDIVCLLECCKLFSREFACYDVSIDLDIIEKDEFYFNELLWDQIAIKVRKFTHKPYKKFDCELKFLSLRTTYRNLKSISIIENTYFAQLKYFKQLKQLIDNQNFNKKSENLYIGVKPEYKALIKQIEINSNDFKGQKNIVWEKISRNLELQGFNLNPKYCQNLFYRLRLRYIDLLRKVSSEEEGILKWPYFKYFKEIDLSPFNQSINKTQNCTIKLRCSRNRRLMRRKKLN